MIHVLVATLLLSSLVILTYMFVDTIRFIKNCNKKEFVVLRITRFHTIIKFWFEINNLKQNSNDKCIRLSRNMFLVLKLCTPYLQRPESRKRNLPHWPAILYLRYLFTSTTPTILNLFYFLFFYSSNVCFCVFCNITCCVTGICTK